MKEHPMKFWLTTIIAALCGMGAGGGWTVLEMHRNADVSLPSDRRQETPIELSPDQSSDGTEQSPKIEVVDNGIFNFGSMERFAKLEHTFRIKNVGNGPLLLRKGKTTCKCTMSELTQGEVPPGEVAEVTLEWTGQSSGDNPEFEQSVELITNVPDQETLRLVIRGYVTETVRALPDELTIGRVSSNTGGEAEFRLFAFRSDQIEILETEFEYAPLAPYFDLAFEPLPAGEVAAEKGASCGLLGKLTVKSGLPLGPIMQTIRIRAMADKEAVIHLPVRGQAMTDMIIASSREYDPVRNLLTFGTLQRAESAQTSLNLFVTGPHRHETRLTVGEIDPPEYFQVEISPPQELNEGKTIKYSVAIQVPPGLPPINRMGSIQAPLGRIVLDATHPLTKEVPIRIKFAIE
jgi:hypothetical protein